MNDVVRGVVLLASLLLWLPFLKPVVDGTMPVDQGLLRYAAALALAWVGGAGMTALVRSYTTAAPEEVGETPLRRLEDAIEQADQQR